MTSYFIQVEDVIMKSIEVKDVKIHVLNSIFGLCHIYQLLHVKRRRHNYIINTFTLIAVLPTPDALLTYINNSEMVIPHIEL